MRYLTCNIVFKIMPVIIGIVALSGREVSYAGSWLQDSYKRNDFHANNGLSGFKSDDDVSPVDVIKGWQAGFSLGLYRANKYSANYYNGMSSRNNLYNIIGKNKYAAYPYNYNYNYDNIKEMLGYDYDLDTTSLPVNMRYDIAVNVGFYAKYNFNNNTGIFFEVNYAKLKTKGVFTLNIENGIDLQAKEQFYLNGAEERVDINMGICKTFGPPEMIKPYYELALNMNNCTPVEMTAYIRDMSFSYFSTYDTYYNLPRGGIGFGVTAGSGVQINLAENFVVYSGIYLSYKNMHLEEYEDYRLHEHFFIRFLYKNFISSREEGIM